MIKTKRIILLFLLLASVVGAETPQKPLSIVVYNMEAQGVQGSIADILTNAVITELSSSEKLNIRDEKTTIAVLKEKGMAQTDYCDAEKCRIDSAKLIKADRIILGTVGKMGATTLIITLRVADVNGTTLYPQKYMCKECSDEQLYSVAEQLARNIRTFLETGKKPKPPEEIHVGDTGTATTPPPTTGPTTPPPTQTGATGTLEVRTNPPGARIIIDASEMGVSNTTVTIAAGKHEVLLVKDGYADITISVDVPTGRKVVLTKNLSAQSGDVEVTVNVAGAQIFLDGRMVGTSAAGRGVSIKNVGVGEHKVKVVHPGYEATEVTVSVAYNQANPVSINLAGKPGKIYVSSTPQGATVKIGGVEKGKTPVSLQLEPGAHTIEVAANGYETNTQNVQIEAGGNKSISVPLKKLQQAVTGGGSPGDMVQVPAGEFTMGSIDDHNEEPPHRVYLHAFLIDKYEVTVQQYQSCVQAGRCTAAHFDDGSCYVSSDGNYNKGTLPQRFRGGNQPVVCVDWNQAKTFCEWAGKMLPTEAEWEKAARGTDGMKYPWGNENASCNYAVMKVFNDGGLGCGRQSTWPVGSKPNGASPYGAMDMTGNVCEWVADWYDENYYKDSPYMNPNGPGSGTTRVFRGGSWADDLPFKLRTSARRRINPDDGYSNGILGFRCVR